MQNRLETMDVNSGTIEKPTRLPVEIVSDILQENKNYFHDLEISSEKLRKEIGPKSKYWIWFKTNTVSSIKAWY